MLKVSHPSLLFPKIISVSHPIIIYKKVQNKRWFFYGVRTPGGSLISSTKQALLEVVTRFIYDDIAWEWKVSWSCLVPRDMMAIWRWSLIASSDTFWPESSGCKVASWNEGAEFPSSMEIISNEEDRDLLFIQCCEWKELKSPVWKAGAVVPLLILLNRLYAETWTRLFRLWKAGDCRLQTAVRPFLTLWSSPEVGCAGCKALLLHTTTAPKEKHSSPREEIQSYLRPRTFLGVEYMVRRPLILHTHHHQRGAPEEISPNFSIGICWGHDEALTHFKP